MKRPGKSPIRTQLTAFLLLASLCIGIVIIDRAKAQGVGNLTAPAWTTKVSPDLSELVQSRNQGSAKVIIQFKGRLATAKTFLQWKSNIKYKFPNFDSWTVDLPLSFVPFVA